MHALITSHATSDPPDRFTVDLHDGPRLYNLVVRPHVPCSPESDRERSTLARSLARKLQAFAVREGHAYLVDASRAQDGVVVMNVAPEGETLSPTDHDILLEIALDACG